ncbi:hypothetical protein FJY68_04560 [candidate division WOR-3 bacterium]|uniref:Uncharacterized protein n=1 Tax=candidate division WOR-3 bacterium TaxID=2052148 RepID=A0A938BQY7_UNCW3|nr:hypothetical protein [candidate division WOR-3 bacterium]
MKQTYGGSSPKPKVRRSRRNSPWPFVIVLGLPILTAVFGLSLWVTTALLLTGTVLLLFSPHLGQKRARDPKKAWFQLMEVFTRLRTAHAALMQSPADAAARLKFTQLETECRELLSSRLDSDWGTDVSYVEAVKKELTEMPAPAAAPAENPILRPQVR